MLGVRNDQRVLASPGTVLTGPNNTVAYLGPFYNDHFRMIRVALAVTAESGTTPALAWSIEFQAPSDLNWYDLLDGAGAAVAGVAFAAAATGLRYLDLLGPDVASEEDATTQGITYGTNYKKYGNIFLPFSMRVKLTMTNGGGTTTKTYHSYVEAMSA